MITSFLIQQHEKQLGILNLIDKVMNRMKIHKRYIANGMGDTKYLSRRMMIDASIVIRLQQYYLNVSQKIFDKVMEDEPVNTNKAVCV